jgi:pimeloyl-ACP methyl ester carboxylesterase
MILNDDLGLRFLKGEGRTIDLLGELERIACPTLVLAGEDDPVTPIEDAADIAGRIPNGLLHFVRFTNAGHGVFRDGPQRAVQVIREFVAS